MSVKVINTKSQRRQEAKRAQLMNRVIVEYKATANYNPVFEAQGLIFAPLR